ncbi:hypothetical protein GCM10010211_69890 [Streptomyces albospinus]|uniref:Fe/B12 periplasmic-binding domain-containing protein n=1 Tax=Streptomyces albospinus TaxID=285515 RepID=A0ABQ2VL28_9ACTN|nr:hypothetical protein GCM10010211_69890 [Streptomyces albospinus]
MTDLSAVEADITSLGAVTGTSAKAKELVAGMKEKVGAVQKAVGGTAEGKRPTYFFFDYEAGTKQPTVICNRQVANAVITLAGARNVFADCNSDRKQVGWEDVIAKNPDWIQLGVRNRGSDAANKKFPRSSPPWPPLRPGSVHLSLTPTTASGCPGAPHPVSTTLAPSNGKPWVSLGGTDGFLKAVNDKGSSWSQLSQVGPRARAGPSTSPQPSPTTRSGT